MCVTANVNQICKWVMRCSVDSGVKEFSNYFIVPFSINLTEATVLSKAINELLSKGVKVLEVSKIEFKVSPAGGYV